MEETLKFAVITVSNTIFSGERRYDASGPVVADLLREYGKVAVKIVVPDDISVLKQLFINLTDNMKIDAIFTTGGTGFSPTDVTPEATLGVADRLAPGITEAMRARSLEITGRAMLSRAVAGIRGSTLIINLPGAPSACRENLSVFLPVMEHALRTLRGETKDCAKDRQQESDAQEEELF